MTSSPRRRPAIRLERSAAQGKPSWLRAWGSARLAATVAASPTLRAAPGLPMDSSRFAPPSSSSAFAASLISAAPLDGLLAALTRDIALIGSRLPGSGELALLQRHRDELARALEQARRDDVWLSPKAISTHTGKGMSTVTKECRDFKDAAGAVRNGKRSWLIHWPTYQAWMTTAGRGRNGL